MTDQEKIAKLEALELLTQRLPGCFGSEDKVFASHTLDEGRAKKLRELAASNNVTLMEVQNMIAGFLLRSGFYLEHVQKQYKVASDFFAKKLP